METDGARSRGRIKQLLVERSTQELERSNEEQVDPRINSNDANASMKIDDRWSTIASFVFAALFIGLLWVLSQGFYDPFKNTSETYYCRDGNLDCDTIGY